MEQDQATGQVPVVRTAVVGLGAAGGHVAYRFARRLVASTPALRDVAASYAWDDRRITRAEPSASFDLDASLAYGRVISLDDWEQRLASTAPPLGQHLASLIRTDLRRIDAERNERLNGAGYAVLPRRFQLWIVYSLGDSLGAALLTHALRLAQDLAQTTQDDVNVAAAVDFSLAQGDVDHPSVTRALDLLDHAIVTGDPFPIHRCFCVEGESLDGGFGVEARNALDVVAEGILVGCSADRTAQNLGVTLLNTQHAPTALRMAGKTHAVVSLMGAHAVLLPRDALRQDFAGRIVRGVLDCLTEVAEPNTINVDSAVASLGGLASGQNTVSAALDEWHRSLSFPLDHPDEAERYLIDATNHAAQSELSSVVDRVRGRIAEATSAVMEALDAEVAGALRRPTAPLAGAAATVRDVADAVRERAEADFLPRSTGDLAGSLDALRSCVARTPSLGSLLIVSVVTLLCLAQTLLDTPGLGRWVDNPALALIIAMVVAAGLLGSTILVVFHARRADVERACERLASTLSGILGAAADRSLATSRQSAAIALMERLELRSDPSDPLQRALGDLKAAARHLMRQPPKFVVEADVVCESAFGPEEAQALWERIGFDVRAATSRVLTEFPLSFPIRAGTRAAWRQYCDRLVDWSDAEAWSLVAPMRLSELLEDRMMATRWSRLAQHLRQSAAPLSSHAVAPVDILRFRFGRSSSAVGPESDEAAFVKLVEDDRIVEMQLVPDRLLEDLPPVELLRSRAARTALEVNAPLDREAPEAPAVVGA